MNTDLKILKKSLEKESKQNKDFLKGVELVKMIVSDFDIISTKINYRISKNKEKALIQQNSKSFDDNVARGFNRRKYTIRYIKEINKQKILNDFRERNIGYWDKINNLGFISIAVISWGIAYRRKAFPVFLNDEELKKYGYESGLDEAFDKKIILDENRFYDKSVYPPTTIPTDNKWSEILLTRGMRFQCVYLFDNLLNKKLKDKNLNTEEKDEIVISLYKNPTLLELLFESLRDLENENREKVSEIEKELLVIYENLSDERKKETKERFKAITKLRNSYKSIGYYSDVYLHANECRRKGLSLDKGLESGVIKYRNSNVFLNDLISRNKNDIKEVINYLHNTYYKSKFKDYNNY